jgi:hypothetical protein
MKTLGVNYSCSNLLEEAVHEKFLELKRLVVRRWLQRMNVLSMFTNLTSLDLGFHVVKGELLSLPSLTGLVAGLSSTSLPVTLQKLQVQSIGGAVWSLTHLTHLTNLRSLFLNSKITDSKGLRKLISLEKLKISWLARQKLAEFDVSELPKLNSVRWDFNPVQPPSRFCKQREKFVWFNKSLTGFLNPEQGFL